MVQAIFGSKIIGLGRKIHSVKASNMVTSCCEKIKITAFVKKGRGRNSEAYIDKGYKIGESNQSILDLEKRKIISNKLMGLFQKDYEVSSNGMIKGDVIIGECDKFKKPKKFSAYSSSHGANQTTLSSRDYCLCYIEPSFMKTQ